MGDGRFPFEVVNGVPVVAAPEEIDITNAPALRSALLEAAAHRHGMLVVQSEGGELLLVIPAIAVLRVFAITGIDRAIPNFTSLDQGPRANIRRRAGRPSASGRRT
jgi:anti-anti-sigma regulatory factor